MKPKLTIWVGWDPREASAFAVATSSIRRRLTAPVPVSGLVLSDLQELGLYRRPITWREGMDGRQVMWDVQSGAPMSTQHACARFWVPRLAGSGWALFTDGDVMARDNVMRLFQDLDPDIAVYCVKHRHIPDNETKMDGQIQTRYHRKNWSSVMIFNCDHPAIRDGLTDELLNSAPGRDLHAFSWLDDDLIGDLDPSWNFLVGITDPAVMPRIVHFTDGVPDMTGYQDVPYADEWRDELRRWAAGPAPFLMRV